MTLLNETFSSYKESKLLESIKYQEYIRCINNNFVFDIIENKKLEPGELEYGITNTLLTYVEISISKEKYKKMIEDILRNKFKENFNKVYIFLGNEEISIYDFAENLNEFTIKQVYKNSTFDLKYRDYTNNPYCLYFMLESFNENKDGWTIEFFAFVLLDTVKKVLDTHGSIGKIAKNSNIF